MAVGLLADPADLRRRRPPRRAGRAAPHDAGVLAGDGRRARLLGGAAPRRRRARGPRARCCSRPARAGSCSRTSTPESLAMMRNMLLAMDPPRHVDYRRPLADELQGQGHRPSSRPRSGRSAARSWPRPAEQGEVEFVHDVTAELPVAGRWASSWACPRRTGPSSTQLAERSDRAARTPTSPAGRRRPTSSASIEMAMYAIEFAGRAGGPSRPATTSPRSSSTATSTASR